MSDYFDFVTVDRLLCDSIAEDLENGRSVVVLGAPGSGKFILKQQVRKVLEKYAHDPIAEINFQHIPPIVTVSDVQERISRAAEASGAHRVEPGAMLLGGLDGFDRSAYVLLECVDFLANDLMRPLLQELRERALREEPKGKVVVLLLGEYDFRDFVYGPGSEVTNFVSSRYVTQGCDFDMFDVFLREDFTYRAVPLPDEPSRRMLFEVSGGDANILLALVTAAVWKCQRRGLGPSEVKIDRLLLDDILESGPQFGLSDVQVLRHALRLIPLDPEVWDNLVWLIAGEKPPLRKPFMQPAALTLSGLVRRHLGRLEFSSVILASAARRVFDNQYFGDLYAQIGNWERAFEFYKKVKAAERLRPLHGRDLLPTISAIRAAKAYVNKCASDGAGLVREFFGNVCSHVLGFPDVSFWHHTNQWEPLAHRSPDEQVEKAARDTIKLVDSVTLGQEIPLPRQWTGMGFAWRLQGNANKRDMFALVGDFGSRRLVNLGRAKLLHEFADAFAKAHHIATQNEAEQRAILFRKTRNEIVTGILTKLGVEIFDVEATLRVSAGLIRNMGYRRIGFTLVDPTLERVDRVVDPENFEGIRPKSYLLSQPRSGVHPFVVASGEPLYVHDAPNNPLADEFAVAACGITAFAVIPIRTPRRNVIGTIYVERSDKVVPSSSEVEDFLELGDLLHSVIQHAQRMAHFQGSLDRIPEPLVIVDAHNRLRYANRRAATLIDVRSGWRPESVNFDSEEEQKAAEEKAAEEASRLAPLNAHMLKAARDGRRVSHADFGFPNDPDFKGSLVAATIQDSLGHTIGAFAHVEDLTYVESVFRALDWVARAHDRKSALAAVLEAAKILGHYAARLYLFSHQDPELLESHAHYDMTWAVGGVIRQSSRISSLGPSDVGGDRAWATLDDDNPGVYCYNKTDRLFRTTTDLVVQGTDRPCSGVPCELGSYWVQAPLVADNRRIGIIQLLSSERLLPEHYHFLKVFFRLVAKVLDLHIHNELTAARMDRERDLASSVTLGLVAHNLGTRSAGLSPLIALYEHLETQDMPELGELNKLLRPAYQEVHSILWRAKEVFRHAPLEAQRVDLAALVDKVLGDSLAGNRNGVLGIRPAFADIDSLQMSSALREIVRNSMDLAAPDSLAVTLDTLPDNPSWIRLSIRDSGPGVPANLKERIFEDFYTHRPGRDPGTGLGLALVRRVAEIHGGRAYEDGVPGSGARFVLELPRFQSVPL